MELWSFRVSVSTKLRIVSGKSIFWVLPLVLAGALLSFVEAKDPGGRPDLGSLRSPDGRQIDVNPPQDGLSVLIFYSSECPISNAYSPTLNSLYDGSRGPTVKWT